MPIIDLIFGYGKDLTATQMSARGIVVFVLTLVLLRIAGRRSFGMRNPLDNIIVILLGAVLSRAVVGASPFLPVACCSLVIVLLHRLLAWMMVRHETVARLVEGKAFVLFEQGKPVQENLDKGLVGYKDLLHAARNKAMAGDLSDVDKLVMESSGDISVIKRKDA